MGAAGVCVCQERCTLWRQRVVLEFEPSVPDFSYKCKIERSKEQHVHPGVYHHEEDKLCDTESHENQNALPYGCIDL